MKVCVNAKMPVYLKKKKATNLGNHRNHGTQRLLSIGVVHNHLLTKVAKNLAAKQWKIKVGLITEGTHRSSMKLH